MRVRRSARRPRPGVTRLTSSRSRLRSILVHATASGRLGISTGLRPGFLSQVTRVTVHYRYPVLFMMIDSTNSNTVVQLHWYRSEFTGCRTLADLARHYSMNRSRSSTGTCYIFVCTYPNTETIVAISLLATVRNGVLFIVLSSRMMVDAGMVL